MKRILALILALMLALALVTTAGATGTTLTTTTTTGDVLLTYTVAQSYTVTIPANITIGAEGTGTGNVIVSGSIINNGRSLKVKITEATNYSAPNFRLKEEATENYIIYTIKTGETAVAMGDAVLSVIAGTTTGSASLTFTANAPTQAGIYTDQLTFTVSVE